MTKLTLADFQKPAAPAANPDWVRVSMDTGGIAAGADEVCAVLEKGAGTLGFPLEVRRVGTLGYSFADPLVEVARQGMPTVVYGGVDAAAAGLILRDHLVARRLLDDHIVASRARGLVLDAPTTAILVKDTAADGGDKTQFFQFSLVEDLKRRGLQDKVQVVRALDLGVYDKGVAVQFLPSRVTYVNVLAADIAKIVDTTLRGKKVLDNLLYKTPDRQMRIVLRHCGVLDPESLPNSLQHGVYQGLAKALGAMQPAEVIGEMKTSGLRGRGGAGFPTWMKWKLTAEVDREPRYIICNGDEGDPGAYMDRSVLEGDPHSVLEGMIIAAFAIGARRGYFYIRAEYPLAVRRVEKAIADARAAGLLGDNILGTGFCFDAKVRLGAGAFVCGEETALIASIEGKRGSPSPRPPYPSVRGLFGQPTAINNVETLAAVPEILVRGGAWYAGFGTEKSRGTKVFAVTGKVRHAQLVEVPLGITLRETVFDLCGGVSGGKKIKAVQTGGPSGGVIPEPLLDTQVTYETLQQLGSIMGSGGMIVMDQDDSMVEVSRFYLRFCVDESCGKCAPCRIGGYQMLQILNRLSRGRGEPGDLERIRAICKAMQKASLCGLGQGAPNPVLTSLRHFESEFKAYLEGGVTYARKMAQTRPAETPAPEPVRA
ncbi:MAG TPA: NADH-ubiquinone oxidoreductase-F iron-sulfur binding region domain-containing protein [Opitutaceae bacterium]|nr:NADH-ubiquinone oxidoreductase-F iron-sulfur binding region domain-containing protein [Opitutaceae bacterium]